MAKSKSGMETWKQTSWTKERIIMMNIVENEHYLLDNEWWQRITEKDRGGHQAWLLQEMDPFTSDQK